MNLKNLRNLIVKRYSIRTRMIISLSILLAAAFLITNYMNYRSSSGSIRDNLINSVLPLTSDNIYTEIQRSLIRPLFISSLMANDTFLKDWAISGEGSLINVKKYLNTIKEKYGFFTVFFVSERTKRYYYNEGILKKISLKDPHDIWYYRFKNLKKEYDLDVDTNEAEQGVLTIFINHRLEDYGGRFLGATGVGLKMDRISSLLHSYNSKYGGEIYLADPDGLIQVHSNKEVIEKSNVKDLLGSEEAARKCLSKGGGNEILEFDRRGEHLLLTVRYIPEFDWYLFVEINETENMGSVRANLYRNLLLGLVLSLLIISVAIITVNYYQKRLDLLAVRDELTGAYNRKEFENQFRRAAYSFKRQGLPFSIILFDLDNFKEVNDTLGHLEGDRVLREIAGTARENIRLTDVLFRWGGDEFVIIAYGKPEKTLVAAERIRSAVEEKNLPRGDRKRDGKFPEVTISCGVSFYEEGDDPDNMLAKADRALYRAKERGRNRTEQG